MTFSRTSLSRLFAAAVLTTLTFPVFAQDAENDAAREDFKNGAIQGASAMIGFPIPENGYQSFAETQNPDKSASYVQGYAAGAECTVLFYLEAMTVAGLLVNDLPNPEIALLDETGLALTEVMAYDAVATCEKAFITRYRLGL